MTDKEKIRAEIVRHLKEDACGDEIAVYNELLSFIDSMQEEVTTSVWHDSSEEPSSDTKVLVTDGAFVLVMNWIKDDKNFHILSPLGFDYTIPLANRYVRWAYIEDILPFNKKED